MFYPTKKLGEVCELIVRGISPRYVNDHGVFILNQKCIRNHEVSWYEARQHDTHKKFSKDKLIKVGDVLVNSTGVGTLGRIALVRTVEQSTVVDSHITIVRPTRGIFNHEYFGFAMTFAEDLIKQMGIGSSGQTELSRSDLRKIEIPVPPIMEQRKIVAKIEKQFAKIDEAARLRAESQARTEKLLPAALHEILSSAESGWGKISVKEALRKTKKINGLKANEYNIEGEDPIVDQGQRIAGYTNERSSVYKGELPLVIFGDHTRILKFIDFPFAIGADGTQLLLPIVDFDPKFFYYALLNIALPARGYSRHFKFLKVREIPLPPLAEQKGIVIKVDALSKKVRMLRDLQASQSADLKALKQSILREAFSI